MSFGVRLDEWWCAEQQHGHIQYIKRKIMIIFDERWWLFIALTENRLAARIESQSICMNGISTNQKYAHRKSYFEWKSSSQYSVHSSYTVDLIAFLISANLFLLLLVFLAKIIYLAKNSKDTTNTEHHHEWCDAKKRSAFVIHCEWIVRLGDISFHIFQ